MSHEATTADDGTAVPDQGDRNAKRGSGIRVVSLLALVLALGAIGAGGYEIHDLRHRLDVTTTQLNSVSFTADQASTTADDATTKVDAAQSAADDAKSTADDAQVGVCDVANEINVSIAGC